ncbi:MAG TPA: tetratricopeptide repeat protein [Aestuariivirga sp.]|nr:tetratricopeptide repeat protein [Aestuariivirga sp.]
MLNHAEPPRGQLDALIALFNQRRLKEVVQQATAMAVEFPRAAILYNILGAAHLGMRNLDEAIASFKKAVQVRPDFAEAHNNLGIALKDQDRLDDAIASFGKALQIKPGFAEAHNNLGIALKGQNRLDEAIASFGKALQIRPDNAEAHSNLGVAMQGQRRLEEAIASFNKALQIKPYYAEAHNNLGIALKDQNRPDEAIASFGKALRIRPDYIEALNSLGLLLQDQGRFDEAIANFGRALQINPDDADAHSNLGAALQAQGRLDEAIASFDRALQINPDIAEVHHNLGVALQDQGRWEEAAASYCKALKIKPEFALAHSNLCGLYEKRNNIEELERALEKATINCADDSNILFRLAQLASRKNKLEDAAGYLNKVQTDRLQPSLKPASFNLLGETCDKLGQFENAFAAFEKQNELTGASTEAGKFNGEEYLNSIRLRKNAWATEVKPKWTRLVTGVKQVPVFLIGFPRSGTTLLDIILRSHPGIGVVEEKPMVTAMGNAFAQAQTVQNLSALSVAGVRSLQDAYFEELKIHLGQDDDGKLVVDKLPLNIAHVGIIHRVFPDAKFILALRHPCDCVLSCFMQPFMLNEAMMNFLSLEQSAKLYAAVMELWSAYQRKLDIDVHALKYEDLIQDLESTCKPLIRFLGLEWHDNLRNYQKTALERGRILTPSYNQVVQPLYKQASGRWIHYRKQMEPVLPVLQPWIEAFGY